MTAVNEIDYKALFESVPGLYLILAPNTNFTIWAVSNPYLEATMTKREEILGKGLFEVFPDNPDDPSADGVSNLRASLQYVLRNKSKHTMAVQKYDIRRPDGTFEERYWNPQNLPVPDGKGGIACIIHRVEDVTDFIRLKSEHEKKNKLADDLRARLDEMEVENFTHMKETQRANQDLTRANQELESFTYTVSHDLKSPLRAIGAFAKILEEDYGGNLDTEATRILETIQNNARKMTVLIENLLEFSKLNKVSINKTRFDMTEMVKGIIEEQKEHKAEVRLGKLHDVAADKALMVHVFTNLITNAIKYSAKYRILSFRSILRSMTTT